MNLIFFHSGRGFAPLVPILQSISWRRVRREVASEDWGKKVVEYLSLLTVIVWLQPATKGPCGCSAAPPPAGVRRRMERNRQKLVGRDKGSLTEQQTKGITTTIWIRRIHKTK